jgi:hypothetical protein
MRQTDSDGSLAGYLNPLLNSTQRKIAEIEGWILGAV